MKLMVLATAMALGSAGFAIAADTVVEDVVLIAPAHNWSGVYVGGQIGYAFHASADYVYDSGSDPNYNYSNDPEGFIGGIYAGYDYQFANGIVVGGEADIVWGDLEDSSAAPGDDLYSATTNIDWTGATRIRLGYALDRFLPYVAGGVAFGHYDFEEVASGAFYGSGGGGLVGWTLGLGGEYALYDNWILRGEYRYTDFDEENFTSDSSGDVYDVDIDVHDIRIGAAYKF